MISLVPSLQRKRNG